MKFAKYFLIISIAIVCLTIFIPIAQATKAPDSPICKIEGQILDIKENEGREKVTLKITNIKTYKDVSSDWIECNEKYKISLEKDGVDYFDGNKTSLEKDMVIKGLVNSGGDEFSGIITTLYKVQVLSPQSNWLTTFILRIRQLFTK